MKVWIGCHRWRTGKDDVFGLFTEEPMWVDNAGLVAGGCWCGAVDPLCRRKVRRILGNRTPEPGELVEIELQPTTTWVMK